MARTPPMMKLTIKTAERGFYAGSCKHVAISSKLVVGALILWAVAFPDHAARALGTVNGFLLNHFATWYILAVAFFTLVCVALALMPSAGRLVLGQPGDRPEFSRFSWFSMMFGAGIGVGMLTFATAEPMYHFADNPDVIRGLAHGGAADNIRSAYVWSFLHWGFSAWATFALVGLSLAYLCYRRNLPLTIRSGLAPLFGRRLAGTTGHVIDIVAVVATVLGVAQTLGFGVEQFVAGLNRIVPGDWMLNDAGKATPVAIALALIIIMSASTLSAASGVGRGIKWLSNLNMGLSLFLLTFFLVFGSTFFGLQALWWGGLDYIARLPALLVTVWRPDGTPVGDALAKWQGDWSVFYWAWWIAFAPFVGLFLARVSRGRTLREYVLGATIAPAVMCFVWFAMVGGTAIDLTLNGQAGDVISAAGQESQLFAMLDHMLTPGIGWAMAVIVVVLLLTFLVTTADSAILIINTINAGGEETPAGRIHVLMWGAGLTLLVAALLMIGGLEAIKIAMVIGALPFSMVMVLMGVALVKAVIRDAMRTRAGVATTFHVPTDAIAGTVEPGPVIAR